jgi:uncharacterized phiE125 gp8 family phage protein
MPLILLTEPEEEPLSLADLKLFLKLDHDEDDTLIGSLISAARRHVEKVTGRRLVSQIWRLVLDAWPADGVVHLPLAPVVAVEAARLRAGDGTPTVLATGGWVLDPASSRLHVPSRPSVLRPFAGIEIDIQAGYGGADDVPPGLKQAVRLLVAHWYENRAVDSAGGQIAVPIAAAALMAPERAVRL